MTLFATFKLFQANLKVEQQQHESQVLSMRAQIADLHGRLQRVGETEAALSARVASQDRKMAQLEGRLFSSSGETTTSSKLSSQVSANTVDAGRNISM